MVTDTPFWISEKPEQLSSYTRLLTCDFCFQHIDSPIPCLIHQTLNNQLVIQISQPLRALTPGQVQFRCMLIILDYFVVVFNN